MLISLVSMATDPDTNYIQTFRNTFAIKTFVNQNNFLYTITPRNNDAFTSQQLTDARVLYTANIQPTLGISLNIKGIGIAYSFKIKNDFNDTVSHVNSDFQQFTMNIYKNRFGFEAYYQDYRRFFYHFLGDQYIYRNYNSDIRDYMFGANAIVLFNGKKFSYNAAFNQTMFQKKSAGSFLLMMSLKYNEIKGDNLIPDSVKNYYYANSYLYRNRNYGFLIHPGYAFDFVKKNFYFASAVYAGVGIQWQTYKFVNNFITGKTAFPISGRAKASLGYNGNVFFTGIYGNYEITQSVIKPMKTQQVIYSYGVYVGLRAIKYTKTKGQLKAEEKRKKLAEKEAKKKEKEAKKKQAEEQRKAKKKK